MIMYSFLKLSYLHRSTTRLNLQSLLSNSKSRRRRLKKREKLKFLMGVNSGIEAAGKMTGAPPSSEKPSDVSPQPSQDVPILKVSSQVHLLLGYVPFDGGVSLVAVRERADLTVVESQGMEKPWPEKKRKLLERPISDLVEGYPYYLRPRLKD